jgi:hypothetical protein
MQISEYGYRICIQRFPSDVVFTSATYSTEPIRLLVNASEPSLLIYKNKILLPLTPMDRGHDEAYYAYGSLKSLSSRPNLMYLNILFTLAILFTMEVS